MTTTPGSRPSGDAARRALARATAEAGTSRAGRRSLHPRGLRRRDRLRLLGEDLAARFGVPPPAVLGVVLLSIAVVAVLGARVVLAGRTVGAGPVVPAAVGPAPTVTAADGLGTGPAGGPAAVVASGVPPSGMAPGAATRATAAAVRPGSAGGSAGGPTIGPAGGVAAGPAGGVIGGPAADPAAGVAGGPVAGSASAPAGQALGEVVVHVVGRVRHPGVVHLPAGSRVQQAVAAAGGARRGADLDRINLARPLVDGEQVLVPRPGQPIGPVEGVAGAVPGSAGGLPPGGSPAPSGGSVQPVDVNTATLAELDSLPGVGPVLAQRILDWRAQNGRFTAVDELGEVSGIGDAVLARLRPLVRL
jgi:competence protein ComEA